MKKNPRFNCEYPFDGTYVLQYNSNNNRVHAKIKSNDGRFIQMHYSRYLMCVKEKRILSPKEHVHHKDHNQLNDDIDNLEILDPRAHNNIHHPLHEIVKLKCPNCTKEFELPGREYRHRLLKDSTYMTCSYRCSGQMSRATKKIPYKFR